MIYVEAILTWWCIHVDIRISTGVERERLNTDLTCHHQTESRSSLNKYWTDDDDDDDDDEHDLITQGLISPIMKSMYDNMHGYTIHDRCVFPTPNVELPSGYLT